MYTNMYEETICMCIYIEYARNYCFSFEYSCLHTGCTWYVAVCTWFILVHLISYLQNSKPFSAQNISLSKLVCTAFRRLHTMLVYRNRPFCTYTVHKRIYQLKTAKNGYAQVVSFPVQFLQNRA